MPSVGISEDRFALSALARFYAQQAWLYDWTRPFFLFGRDQAVAALLEGYTPANARLVVEVGCGTGRNLPALARTGAEVVGVECAPAMLSRAQARLCGLEPGDRVRLDPRPYGSHDDYHQRVDRMLFSYSLSMIPPFEDALGQAWADLRPGGRIAVVDFLDARPPFRAWLAASHVHLGPDRLHALRRHFPEHRLNVRSAGTWRYYLFVAAR